MPPNIYDDQVRGDNNFQVPGTASGIDGDTMIHLPLWELDSKRSGVGCVGQHRTSDMCPKNPNDEATPLDQVTAE
jgi:hypothetical protein